MVYLSRRRICKVITLKFDGKMVEVKKNDAGLYCLNDIFKASGN